MNPATALTSSLRHAAVMKSGSSSTVTRRRATARRAVVRRRVSGSTSRTPCAAAPSPRAAVSAENHTTAGTTVDDGQSRPTRSTCSTPFCSAHTTVCSSHSRASQPAAASFWVSLTASSTTSTGPSTSAGSVCTGRAPRSDRRRRAGPRSESRGRAPAQHDLDARRRAGGRRRSSRWRRDRRARCGVPRTPSYRRIRPSRLWQSSRQAFPRSFSCCAAMPPVRCGPPTPVRR